MTLKQALTFPKGVITLSCLCLLHLTGGQSCNSTNTHPLLEQFPPIVLIFHQPPLYQPLPFQAPGEGAYWPPKRIFTLSYINAHFLPTFVDFGSKSAKPDTLVLFPEEEWMNILHDYHSLETWPFWFKAGDTVHFSYEEERPIATIANRITRLYDVNYEGLKREALGIRSWPSKVVRDNFHFLFTYHQQHPGNTIPESKAAFEQELYPLMVSELEQEQRWLDSIHLQGVISPEVYDFFRQSLRYDSLIQAFHAQKGPINPGRFFVDFDTTLLRMPIFHQAWRTYMDIGIREDMPRFKTANGFRIDARAYYDSLERSPFMVGKVKELALHRCLENVILGFSIEDRRQYMAKFEQILTDPYLVVQLRDAYSLEQPISSALYLENLEARPDSLKGLLATNQGRVLYVDFWASWCAPCLRAMPDAAELRARLREEAITFVYISLDEQKIAWEKAALQLGFDSLVHNYRISNRRSSLFLEELNMGSIPRYLIYDQQGDLIYSQAPGPGDSRTEGILRALAGP